MENAERAGVEDSSRPQLRSVHDRMFSIDELKELAEISADWLWETDSEHRFTWLSESFEQITGIDRARVLGVHRTQFVKRVDAHSPSAQRHLAILEAHEPFSRFIYETSAATDRCRWVSISGVPRFDEHGNFIGYRGIGRNVTRTLHAVDELRETRSALHRQAGRENMLADTLAGGDRVKQIVTALDAMEDAFCCYDHEDRLIFCNQAMIEMYTGLEDVIRPGMTFAELVDAGLERDVWITEEFSKEEWRDCLLEQRRDSSGFEKVFRFFDGRWIMQRERKTEDGGTIAICTDITELKSHECELEKARSNAEAAQQRLQSAIDALNDGFVLWDSEDRLVACNKAFRRQFSFMPHLQAGRTFGEMFLEFAHTGIVKEAVGREEEWAREHMARRAEELDRDIVFETHDNRWIMRRDTMTATGDRVGIRTDITEHKQRSVELARAKARSEEALSDLKRTIDSMRLGIMVVDRGLHALLLNHTFCEMWGIDSEEFPVGSHYGELMERCRAAGYYDVTEEEWEDFVAWRLGEIESGVVVPREFRRADGRTLIYSVTALSGGKRLISFYDVTEMKDREAQLEEALEKSRLAEAVIDSVPNPIFVKDPDLEFVLANKAFADIYEVEPAQMLGKKAIDFSSPEDTAFFEGSERSVLDTGELYEVEEDFEEDGLTRTRLVRKYKVTTASAKDYVAATVVDVTDMKRRERDAEEARQRLAYVLESLPAGVVIYDRDDRFVLANRLIQETLPAMRPAMQPGRTLRDALELAHDAGYFRDSGDAELDGLYDTDRERWVDGYLRRYHSKHHVFERMSPNGRWYQVFDTRTKDGTFIGVRVDITELKTRERELMIAQEKAVQADRAKSEFLANMSHEIRTPMNGVLGMAELLARTELSHKQKTFIDIIMKSGGALLNIINDILDFSKIDAGQVVLEEQPFNLAEAIEDVAMLMSARAKEKDIETIVRVAPELPPVLVGDAGRVRQIITNLMGNAVKFTETGHVLVEVTGHVESREAHLRVCVSDTGIGIPPDKVELIFDKFSQVDSSSTRRHEGTGLGLAITARLVGLMGGEMGVESTPGEGSTFWFTVTMPVADAVDETRPPPLDVSGARVLVIDDNAINRTILSELMDAWGFDACAAENGKEGLKVLEAAAKQNIGVDCVVLDYQMPGLSGVEVAQALRLRPAIADTPIILLSSVDQPLPGAQMSKLNITTQLAKPARSSSLLEALINAIQMYRAGDAQEGDGAARSSSSSSKNGHSPTPDAAEAEAPDEDAADEAPENGPRTLDILVAEDNEVNQLVFSQILNETGLTFEIVDNGKRAVEVYRRETPSMVLMDVSMPEMNGLEATAAIRAVEAETGVHVPIVGVTAHALKGDRERCIDAGMDDYLSKPVSPKLLLQKIERWAPACARGRNRQTSGSR